MRIMTAKPWHPFRGNARRSCVIGNRAIAAVEFALVAPVMLLLLGAASDYGLMTWSRSCLANAVAQGAYYAFRTGTAVTSANVVTLVRNASSLSATSITATATDPAKCYCPSGMTATTLAALGTAVASCTTSTCPDGSRPGHYMTITANYTLTGFFALGNLTTAGKQISETVTVPLK
jgi:Flp pilus assembly protein TadG